MERTPLKVWSSDEAAARLAGSLPHWRVEGTELRRSYRTQGWKGSLMLAGAIAHLAELAWHHPDLALSFGKVEIRLSTHDHHGITERDFALAEKIEEVACWRPGLDGGALEGTPADPKWAYVKDDPPA